MQDEVIVVDAPILEEVADPENEAVVAEFEEVKADVAAGREPSRSVRELLRWFGARRRRGGVVERIEAELEAAGLRTDPHFTTTWIDAPVIFKKREAQAPAAEAAPVAAAQPGAEAVEPAKPEDFAEMTHLVRMLEAANREVISVNPQDPIERAVTLMLAYDFSQLAVMTGPRDLRGQSAGNPSEAGSANVTR